MAQPQHALRPYESDGPAARRTGTPSGGSAPRGACRSRGKRRHRDAFGRGGAPIGRTTQKGCPMSAPPFRLLAVAALLLLVAASLPASAQTSRFAVAATQAASFLDAADAYVASDTPSSNFGTSKYLYATSSPTQRSYVRFDVSGLSGTVSKATLRLFVRGASSSGFAIGTSTNSWSETGITSVNAPAVSPLTTVPAYATSYSWMTFDVTRAVGGNGSITFVLSSSGSASFYSREAYGAGYVPELIVETTGTTTSTAPVNTTVPTISGTDQVGQVLTASAGTWSGLPTAYAYQWRRCDSAGASCPTVAGATASSYKLASADQGSTMRVAVTASNAYGAATATSAATAVVQAAPASSPGSTSPPYSSGSPFNTPVPANPQIDPNSSGMISRLSQASGSVIAVKGYSVPVFYADNMTPRYDVQLTASWRSADYLTGVPIPANAAAASGTDAHMVVVNLSTGCEYDFYKTAKTASGWQAGWANAQPVTSPGVYPKGLSTRGSGFGLLAGLIQPAELQNADGTVGHIPHALIFSSPFVKEGGPVLPATESDGHDTAANAIPEGARVQLNPAFDESTLAKGYERAIARALKEYGAYLGDVSGSPVDFYAADPKGFSSNPYGAIWGDQTYVSLPMTLISNLRVLQLPAQYPSSYAIVANGCNIYR
jgi:hypothetical protein